MVKVIAGNGKFKVKGTFDLGYMGLYRDDKIIIDGDSGEIRKWKIADVLPYVRYISDDQLAYILTGFVNGLEEKIQQNIKRLNDEFLWNMFSDMYDGGIEFWDCRELTVPELMPVSPTFENIYRFDSAEVQEFYEAYRNAEAAGMPDVEAFLRRILPVFNWNDLLRNILPEHLHIKEDHFSFQCSDGFGGTVLCHAYDELNEKLEFTDWHNF